MIESIIKRSYFYLVNVKKQFLQNKEIENARGEVLDYQIEMDFLREEIEGDEPPDSGIWYDSRWNKLTDLQDCARERLCRLLEKRGKSEDLDLVNAIKSYMWP